MATLTKFEVMSDKRNVAGMCALISCFFNINISIVISSSLNLSKRFSD
jgi:phage shock protein PspC (stress-responsive transcriptional regulator)